MSSSCTFVRFSRLISDMSLRGQCLCGAHQVHMYCRCGQETSWQVIRLISDVLLPISSQHDIQYLGFISRKPKVGGHGNQALLDGHLTIGLRLDYILRLKPFWKYPTVHVSFPLARVSSSIRCPEVVLLFMTKRKFDRYVSASLSPISNRSPDYLVVKTQLPRDISFRGI